MRRSEATVPGFPISLAFAHQGRRMEVEVTGRIDGIAPLVAMLRAVGKAAQAAGSDRILVIDHTLGVVPGETDMRHLMAALQGSRLAALRLAYVDARGTAVARMEVGEIVAREHGYDCRVFDSEARARLWLDYGAA